MRSDMMIFQNKINQLSIIYANMCRWDRALIRPRRSGYADADTNRGVAMRRRPGLAAHVLERP